MSEQDNLRRALVVDTVTHDDPGGRLLGHLIALDARQDLESQAAVFEEVCSQVEIRHFWVLYRMRQVYADLGRSDLAFLVASLAEPLAPPDVGTAPLTRQMFDYHVARSEVRAAIDVFLRQLQREPEKPIAERWEVDPMVRQLGLSLDPLPVPPSPGSRCDHALFAAMAWAPEAPAAVGGRLPVELAKMRTPLHRYQTIVAELVDAEVFIRNDSFAVVDRDGLLHRDVSLGPYPHVLRERVEADPEAVALTRAEAVLVLDPHPAANLGHFLLDQISRLGLYQRAGAGLPNATVIGARLSAGFQQAIATRAPVTEWMRTDLVARVRVGRLWVSTECREIQHPAQLCAPWTLGFLHDLLGRAAVPGRRKLFVSRADAAARRLVNEARLLPLLEARGFEVIVPAAMEYDAQLAAFRDASHVIAVHGAALAHLLVCAPGTHVLEMFHPLYGTWAYAMLAQASGLAYTALVGRDGVSDAAEFNDLTIVGDPRGRFGERHVRVDPTDLAQWLEATA